MTKVKTLTKDNDGQSFALRLMPNAKNPSNSCIQMSFAVAPGEGVSQNFYTYVLEDGEIVIYRLGKTLQRMITLAISGYIGTPDGRFVAHTDERDEDGKRMKVECYYATSNLDYITTREDAFLEQDHKDDNGIKAELFRYTDMVTYQPRNPFELQGRMLLAFDVCMVSVEGLGRDLMKLSNIRWAEAEKPVYDGGDKEPILALYKDVASLEYARELHVKDVESRFPNSIFDEDAKREYLKKRYNTTL